MLTLDDLINNVTDTHAHKHVEKVQHHKHNSHTKKQKNSMNGFREVTKIGVVLLVSFLVGHIVTNAQLYGEKINDTINGVTQFHVSKTKDKAQFTQNKKQEYLETLFKSKKKHTNVKSEIYAYYRNRPQSLDFQFNTLPPDKRIIIPDLGIQAPIITVDGDISAKMKDGHFTEELKKWTVWYPTTPGPWEKWMTMIVGHTSNYFRVKSAYNTVFSKIPQLKEGQKIQIIRDGKMYEYAMREQKIVKPSEVDDVYKDHYDDTKKKIAIMGCYPIGTQTNRMIIIAEPLQEKKANTELAYHATQ